MDDTPRKIYVEVTTRCNLRCRMCLKYAEGCCITDEDMTLPLFARLQPSFATTRFLVLNGIGEPLLHPRLETMIGLARAAMPPEGVIGFQSNGLLLDEERALVLIEAGLDTVCLSLDNMETPPFTAGQPGEHAFTPVAKALGSLLAARKRSGRLFSIGMQAVVSRGTIDELPSLVDWAGRQGVGYLIVSHLFAHDGCFAEESLFNPNGAEAVAIFRSWRSKALTEGLDLDSLLTTSLQFSTLLRNQRFQAIYAGMQQEARERDIHLHLGSLLLHERRIPKTADALFGQAQAIAYGHGMRLSLPPLQARVNTDRRCSFIDDSAAFVAVNGDVMPCHFLWHTAPCLVNDGSLRVEARIFGNIGENSLDAIWQSPAYRQFRTAAAAYDYSSCWTCSQGPCADLVNANSLAAHDCFGSEVPCGHCMWNLGWTACL